jgi:hypothetical protein
MQLLGSEGALNGYMSIFFCGEYIMKLSGHKMVVRSSANSTALIL